MSLKVLSYHDVLLRQQDVDLLGSQDWLNDQIISFCFEYLDHEVTASDPDILMIGPSMAYLLGTADEAVAQMITEPLQLTRCKLVLLPINDNPSSEVANGGSHWSLMIYDRGSKKNLHFTSMTSANSRPAQRLAAQLRPLLGDERAKWQAANAPQQENGNDCGVYTVAMAEEAVRMFLEHRSLEGLEPALQKELTPAAIKQWRTKILHRIQALQATTA